MLRALIAVLLVVNLVFFGWSQGWLDAVVGVSARGEHEPERLLRQVDPGSIRLLPPGAAAAPLPAASMAGGPAASAGPACFETGPFAAADWAAAQAALQAALPGAAFATVTVAQPGSWIVYMGRYADREAQARKEDELRRRNVAFTELGDPPALAPGLSLGRFEQRAAATQALDRLAQQGIRTARVVELAPASTRTLARFDAADAALAGRIAALKGDAIAGRGLVPCKGPAGG